jgi:hypothetical protein
MDILLTGFNDTNFHSLFTPTLELSIILLVVGVIMYNFQGRRLHAYSVFLDLNEWLLWTTMAVFLLLIMYCTFGFDFIFVLPTMVGGAALFIWIRFIHFPPLIQAYEERLARQRYFQRSRVSHPEATIRAKASSKPKRRRR